MSHKIEAAVKKKIELRLVCFHIQILVLVLILVQILILVLALVLVLLDLLDSLVLVLLPIILVLAQVLLQTSFRLLQHIEFVSRLHIQLILFHGLERRHRPVHIRRI